MYATETRERPLDAEQNGAMDYRLLGERRTRQVSRGKRTGDRLRAKWKMDIESKLLNERQKCYGSLLVNKEGNRQLKRNPLLVRTGWKGMETILWKSDDRRPREVVEVQLLQECTPSRAFEQQVCEKGRKMKGNMYDPGNKVYNRYISKEYLYVISK